MSKQSKRPGRAARDIHAAIRADANKLNASTELRAHLGEKFPELNALLEAYQQAVAKSVPSSIVFEGRRYYGRCRLRMILEVFDSPGTADPLVTGVHHSNTDHGHAPGH